MPTTAGPSSTSEQNLALARQFFDAQGLAPGPSFVPHPVELARLNHMPSGPADLNHDAWVMEQRKYQAFRPEDMQQGGWASEFRASLSDQTTSPSAQQNIVARPDCAFSIFIYLFAFLRCLVQRGSSYMLPMNMHGNSMPMHGLLGAPFNGMSPSIVLANQEKGKGKSTEADFEAAFAQVAASLQHQSSTIEEVKDDVEELNEVMEKTKLEQDGTGANVDFKKYVRFPTDLSE